MIHPELNGHDTWVVKSLEDLDFSQDIESDDDSSYFAADGAIQLFDFYVATDDVDGFATALEGLCEDYTTEEEFYFDYEESEEDDIVYATISNFDITLEDAEGFLDDLDALCNEWAEDENYNFSLDEADDTDTTDDADADSEEEEASLILSDFYVYTTDGEKVVEKIDKLCAKHSKQSDYYALEWEEDEDDDGTYILFSTFEITPDDEEKFLSALEALCEKVCDDGGYNWE
ncbi:MAG: hypothetical protein RI964_955 [Pseudomonadota bacterium]